MSDTQTLAHGDSWREWGKQFGWTLYGWTEDYSASFYHADINSPTIQMTKAVRADIDAALARARGES